MIEAIQAATSSASALTGSANTATSALTQAATGTSESKQPFADLLTDSVGQVNQLEAQAKQTVEGLMNGSGVDVHTAVIATQKADAAFELALAVRNKAVAAYQSVMGMQF